MKRLQLIGALAISMIIIACGGGESSATDNVETSDSASVDYSFMEQVNLFDFGVDANIQLPKEYKGPRRIENSATESVTIEVSNRFGIEINPFGLTVSEKKEELDGDLVYTIEYMEEIADKIIYKKSIANTEEIEAEYHFYLTKSIRDELYSIQSLPKVFSKKAIDKMIVSAESVAANNSSE
tara:strand:+ start:41251 stop:41796 length:546 start_codon:yes stop_codon:yes gene_type:complete